MSAPFGISPQGFNAMTLRDILRELESDELAQIGPLLDLSADQPVGQLNGIFARQLAKLWEIAPVAYSAFDRDKASDEQLSNIGKLTGTLRNGTDDATFRAAQENDLTRTGTTTVDEIRAAIFALKEGTSPAVPQLQSVRIFENTTTVTDGNGLPPSSFQALIYDGDSPDAGNADKIAQAIWNSKPAGIRSFGTVTGNVVDKLGGAQRVQFERITPVPVYLAFQLRVDASYVGDALFEQAISDFANAAFASAGAGTPVIAARARSVAFLVRGVVDVLSVTLGRAPSPVGTANLPMGLRELARFSPAHIDVTVVP